MKNKLYVANYSIGSYDDFYVVSVFVSDDKKFVKKWVKKFNTKLEYWKEHFKQFGNPVFDYKTIKEEFYDKVNDTTFYRVMDCNGAFIDEMRYRNPHKKK